MKYFTYIYAVQRDKRLQENTEKIFKKSALFLSQIKCAAIYEVWRWIWSSKIENPFWYSSEYFYNPLFDLLSSFLNVEISLKKTFQLNFTTFLSFDTFSRRTQSAKLIQMQRVRGLLFTSKLFMYSVFRDTNILLKNVIIMLHYKGLQTKRQLTNVEGLLINLKNS